MTGEWTLGIMLMEAASLETLIFLLGTLLGAVVAGLSGFAFGLVATSIWLFLITPVQSASLIVAFGLIIQSYSVWKPRHALAWKPLWPFIAGAAFGVPAGVVILNWANPAHVRIGVGVFLVLFSLYSLFRPAMKPVTGAGVAADVGVGIANGVLAGITGLAAIIVILWCGLRGWPKDKQRAVFQPVAVAIFLMSAFWLGAKGAVTTDTIKLFLFGLPVLLAGTWLGMKVYGRLDETAFRKVVLGLLVLSGVALVLLR